MSEQCEVIKASAELVLFDQDKAPDPSPIHSSLASTAISPELVLQFLDENFRSDYQNDAGVIEQTLFDVSKYELFPKGEQDEQFELNVATLPGIKLQGRYYAGKFGAKVDEMLKFEKNGKQIVSFLYNHPGELNHQKDEKLVIVDTIGFIDVAGQPKSLESCYLVGRKIGSIGHENQEVLDIAFHGDKLETQHFFIADIIVEPVSETTLANRK
jgi:hypothetical protein